MGRPEKLKLNKAISPYRMSQMLSNSMPILLVILIFAMVMLLSNQTGWRLSGPATWSAAKLDPDHLISDGLDRRFSGLQSCGYTLQLFDQRGLATLLQLPGLVLNFGRKPVGLGTNLRNRLL